MHKSLQELRKTSLVRYILIGGTAFILDFTLLHVGLKIGLPLLLANGISVTVAILYSFIMHRTYTFAHQAVRHGYAIDARTQFIIFVVVSLGALFLSELLVTYMVNTLNWSPGAAKIVSSAVLFVWNYVFNRLLTFRVNVTET